MLDQQEDLILKLLTNWLKKTVSFSEIERCVTTLFDGMKSQEHLVWDKHLGDFIRFVDLGDININYAAP